MMFDVQMEDGFIVAMGLDMVIRLVGRHLHDS